MKRSDFIKAFGLGTTGLIIPNTNWSQKSIKIYDNYIKGLVHYHYKELKKQLQVGSELILVRELTNTYDSFAVAIFYDTYKLGYLPAYENIILANLLEQGVALKGFVSKHNPTNIYEAVSIEVYVNLVVEQTPLLKTDLLAKRADDAHDVYRKGFIE